MITFYAKRIRFTVSLGGLKMMGWNEVCVAGQMNSQNRELDKRRMMRMQPEFLGRKMG